MTDPSQSPNLETAIFSDTDYIWETPDIKAVIFDLDGTLLDTESLAIIAIQQVLNTFPGTKPLTFEFHRTLLGLRGPAWSPMVVKEFGLEGKITPVEVVNRMEQNLAVLCQQVQKMPGVEELTKWLHEKGVKMAVATSSRSDALPAKAENHRDMFDRLEFVVCGDDPEVKQGKPNPDIYLVAARRLGVDPKNCLAFEDAITGVRAAKAAGMHVVACPDRRQELAPFEAETPHVSYPSLEAFDKSKWNFISISLSTK